MLAQVRLGPGPRVRKRRLETFPEVDVFQNYLGELSASPPGAQFDFSWQMGSDVYTVTLKYSHGTSVADWKLYHGEAPHCQLVWEHETNDVTLIYNLVAREIDHSAKTIISAGTLATLQKFIESPETRKSSQVNSDRTVTMQPSITASQQGLTTLSASSFFQNGSMRVPPSSSIEAIGKEAIEPVITSVDLTGGRQLIQRLLASELQIFSYPAFLLSLEQEYYKAAEANTALSIVILRIEAACHSDNPYHYEPLTPQVLAAVLNKIKGVQRKTDILAHYEGHGFVALLPETNTAGAKCFVHKVQRAMLNSKTVFGISVKVTFGIAELGDKCRHLPALLSAAEQAVVKALQIPNGVATCQEIQSSTLASLNSNQAIEPRAVPKKSVDLRPMHDLAKNMLSSEYGIFSCPSFLVFLEREYYRALRNSRELFVLLLKIGKQSSFVHTSGLLDSALSQPVQQVMQHQGKCDIFAHYSPGKFIMMRPNATAKALATFARQVVKPAFASSQQKCQFDADLSVCAQVCSVQRNGQAPHIMDFIPITAIL